MLDRMTRIDWHLTSLQTSLEGDGSQVVSVGPFPESSNLFLETMFRWFDVDDCPNAKRLGFGAFLVQPVESKEDGYRLIASYLPHVELDPSGSSEFLYQINRPRESRTGITGLKINRLSKWSVLVQTRALISVGPEGVSQDISPSKHAGRLELDINTRQDFDGTFARAALSEVFRELVDLGAEMASDGDIP